MMLPFALNILYAFFVHFWGNFFPLDVIFFHTRSYYFCSNTRTRIKGIKYRADERTTKEHPVKSRCHNHHDIHGLDMIGNYIKRVDTGFQIQAEAF